MFPAAELARLPAASAEAAFRVGGFVPFSTCDWPGRLAAVVFTQGCPWRCGYCHNAHLVPPRGEDERDWPRLLRWLDSRRGLLDAIVFSGGEPTAQAGLAEAIAAVRAKGFAVGLHTAGAYPRRLADVLQSVDWVGFDLKAPKARYADLTGDAGGAQRAFAALDLVRNSGVAFEVRTTVHPRWTPDEALISLAHELVARGVSRWTLQPFRPDGCRDADAIALAPHGAAVAPKLLTALRAIVPVVHVRAD